MWMCGHAQVLGGPGKEQEELKKQGEVKVQRQVVDKKLEKATGFPPRDKVQDAKFFTEPQGSLWPLKKRIWFRPCL